MNCAFLYSGFSICSDKGEGTCAWTRISDDVKGGPGTKSPSRGVAGLGMGPKTDPIEVALILLYPSICTRKTETKFYRNFACRWERKKQNATGPYTAWSELVFITFQGRPGLISALVLKLGYRSIEENLTRALSSGPLLWGLKFFFSFFSWRCLCIHLLVNDHTLFVFLFGYVWF